MLNGLDHSAALEYAEAFNLAIANDGEQIDAMLERWHESYGGDNPKVTSDPTNYQLAWLRGIESAALMLSQGPKFNPSTVVLDERFSASTIYGG